MNRNVLFFFLGLLLPMSLFANNEKLTVRGKLADAGGKLYVSEIPFGGYYVGGKDSVAVQPDGTFEYTLSLAAPTQISFYKPFDASDETASVEGFSLPAIPGETAVVNGSINDYELSGSDFYKQYAEVNKLLQQQSRDFMASGKEISNMSKAVKSAKDSTSKAEAEAKLNKANAEMEAKTVEIMRRNRQFALNYIRQHPASDVSAAIIAMVGNDSLKSALNTLSASVANGRMKPAVDAVKAALKKHEDEAVAKETIKAGNPAPDFTLKTPDGSTLSLKDLRGKYVLLDFWGTWCGWCVKGIPDMKKAYEKHKDKAEFLSIDCGDTQEKWLDALKKYQMPWKHVKNESSDGVPTKYSVQGYPTKMLVNPDGTINFIFVGEAPEFYTKLDEALK